MSARKGFPVALLLLAGCVPSREPEDPQALTANQAWVQNACKGELFDPTDWPGYEYQGVQVSVPAPYRQTSSNPEYPVFVRTPRGSVSVWRHREARYAYDALYKQVHLGQVSCAITFGRLPAEVVAWYDRGEFLTAVRVAPQGSGTNSEKWLLGIVRSKALADATMLRHVLRTVTLVPSPAVKP